MSAYEERKALMEAAVSLSKDLRGITAHVNFVVSRLVQEADALLPAAADEVAAGEAVQQKVLTYGRTQGQSGTVGVMPILKGKRACSLCRQVGHRAKNCPNAHEVRAADIARQKERVMKKVRERKPVSPERRAQLARSLEKARAARRGKK